MERDCRVWILMNSGVHYARGVIKGILNYSNRPNRRVFLLADPKDASQVQAIAPAIRERETAGIIMHINDPGTAKALEALCIPVVNTGNAFGSSPRVGVDDQAVGRMAAQQFISQGFHNFGFVHFASWEFSTQRCAGFAAALAEKGFSCDEFHDPPHPPVPSRGPLGSPLSQWILGLPKPVAVMTAVDGVGNLLALLCAMCNIRVPEEVAIIGVDNDPITCRLCDPPLSSVELPLDAIGASAMAILDDWVDGKEPPSRPVLLPPVRVVQRQSSDILMVDDPDVAAALQFIREHAAEPIKVGDILRAVPVARRSLERRFSRRMGRGLLAEIRRVRIELAKELLASTALDMPSIAERAGFGLAITFSKVFRTQMKMSPTQYRRLFHTRGQSVFG